MKLIGEIAMIELINEATIQDIQAKYYPDIDLKTIQRLNALSPDYNESQPDRKTNYLPWLINQYVNSEKNNDFTISNTLYNNERFNAIKGVLARFDKIKNELPTDKRDIRKFSGREIVELITVEFKGYVTQKEKKQIIKNESKILYDTDVWRVVVPLTYEASKFWGLNTKWCTTWTDNRSYFDNYTSDGPLYINIDKRNNKKWQFHFETETFCDEQDVDLRDSEELRDKLGYEGGEEVSIFEISNMPEEVYEFYIKERGDEAEILKNIIEVEAETEYWPGEESEFIMNGNEGDEIYFVNYGDHYSIESGEPWSCPIDDQYGITDITGNIYYNRPIEYSDEFCLIENSRGRYDFLFNNDGWFNHYDDVYSYEEYGGYYVFEYDGYLIEIQDGSYPVELDMYGDYEYIEDLNTIAIETSDGWWDFYNIGYSDPYISDVKKIDGEFKYDENYLYSIDEDGVAVRAEFDPDESYHDDIDFEEFDDDDEDENHEPQMDEIRNHFWKTTNKLNEINKRNCDGRIN